MSSQDEARTQRDEKKLREQMLGKKPLRARLKEIALGSHNLTMNKSGRGLEKTLAVEKEDTKLAKLLAARQMNGERDKTRRRRKKRAKPIAERKKNGMNQK